MSLLKSWQPEHVDRLLYSLQHYGRVGDTSDTGTGKTFTALAVAAARKVTPFIVCPLAAKPQWREACRIMGTPAEIVHWEQAKGRRRDVGREDERTLTETRWLIEKPHGDGSYINWKLNYGTMIFDEAHRASGMTSLESKMVIAAHRQAKHVMLLSATMCESPLHLKALGYALGLHGNNKLLRVVDPITHQPRTLIQFRNWVMKYGVKPGYFGGYKWTEDEAEQQEWMAKIRADAGPRLVAMLRENIPGFPETLIEPWLVAPHSIPEAESLSSELKNLNEAIARRKEQGEAEDISEMEEQTRLRQCMELMKVPGIVELVRDSIDSHRKAVVFLNYSESIDLMYEQLDKHVATVIYDGRRGEEEKRRAQLAFQQFSARAIVVQTKAGGTGLNLHIPGTEIDSYASPCYSGRDMLQLLGRVHRADGEFSRQRICLLAGSDEEHDIYPRMRAKLASITSFNGLTFHDGEALL